MQKITYICRHKLEAMGPFLDVVFEDREVDRAFKELKDVQWNKLLSDGEAPNMASIVLCTDCLTRFRNS